MLYLTKLLQQFASNAASARGGLHVQVLDVEGATRPARVGAVAQRVRDQPPAQLRHQTEEPRGRAVEAIVYDICDGFV